MSMPSAADGGGCAIPQHGGGSCCPRSRRKATPLPVTGTPPRRLEAELDAEVKKSGSGQWRF